MPLLEALCYCSVTKSCLTPCNQWTAAICAPLSYTTSWSLPRFGSIALAVLSNHLILCHSLCLLPSIFPSTRVFFFSIESALGIRWPKYWGFSFNISPSMNIQGGFPLGLTGLISLLSKGLSQEFSYTLFVFFFPWTSVLLSGTAKSELNDSFH